MNKMGHLAFGTLLGSVFAICTTPMVHDAQAILSAEIFMGGVMIGSLTPDIDHKTSTASKLIAPFSASSKRALKRFGIALALVGILLWMYRLLHQLVSVLPELPEQVLKAWPLLIGAGVLLLLLARLRDLVLLGVGAWLLYAYMTYHLHWFVAFAGAALMIVPVVKHRGIIHTPEFAFVISIGTYSLVHGLAWYWVALATGLIVGWWAHLAGDLFGSDGIHSLFAPKVNVALHLFANGGQAERWITRLSLAGAIYLWLAIFDPTGTLPRLPHLEGGQIQEAIRLASGWL